MKLASKFFVGVLTLVTCSLAQAQQHQKTNIVDQFTCTIQVDPFKDQSGVTATMKLSSVREQWMNGSTMIQASGNDVEANIQTPTGLEVQLHYDYAFKNGGSGWSLYRCLSGYTKYKGQQTTWACSQMAFVVSALNGVPQFGQYSEKDQDLIAEDNLVGTLTCRLNQTLVTK